LAIFGRGAPEEQASGNFSDRHRYVECCGDTENAILQGGGARPFRDRHASRAVAQRLEFLLEGVIQLRVHPGAAAHTAGFLDGDVFNREGRILFGHNRSFVPNLVERSLPDLIRIASAVIDYKYNDFNRICKNLLHDGAPAIMGGYSQLEYIALSEVSGSVTGYV
jgi:hypothetical protein